MAVEDAHDSLRDHVLSLKTHLDGRFKELAAAREREWAETRAELRARSGCFTWLRSGSYSSQGNGGGRDVAEDSKVPGNLEMCASGLYSGAYRDRVSNTTVIENPIRRAGQRTKS